MFTIRDEGPRGIATWEYRDIAAAKADFDVLKKDLKKQHILSLIDESGAVLDRYPPIPSSMQFDAVIRAGGSGDNVKVTIPAAVRDSMELTPMTQVRIIIQRID